MELIEQKISIVLLPVLFISSMFKC